MMAAPKTLGECRQPGCHTDAIAKGLCRKHYSQARRGRLGPDLPEEGSPSGFGRYGVVDRDEYTILCHECGQRFEALAYHLRRAHEMTADEYRAAHGLPRTAGLVSLGVSRTQSERARERVGSPAWQRLEAKRDPVAASHARDEDAVRSPAVRRHAAIKGAEVSRTLRGTGDVKTCPVCGAKYRGRPKSCSPECAAQAKRRHLVPRLAPEDVQRVRSDPDQWAPRLLERGFGRRAIAEALGWDPGKVYRRWPV